MNPPFQSVPSPSRLNAQGAQIDTAPDQTGQTEKRLTEVAMVEINRLYRLIGKCEQQKADLPRSEIEERPSESGEPWTLQPIPRARYIKAALGLAIVLGLYFLVRKFR